VGLGASGVEVALTQKHVSSSDFGCGASRGVSDGTRTRDRLDHNQELYLLSYAHHGCRPAVGAAEPALAI
jgi:hypothetical protein